MLIAEPILEHPRLRHAFFTRNGGVSEGRWTSLNCGLGSGDDPERVRENRARAMRALDLDEARLVTARQVHSARAVVVETPWPAADRPELDGLATRTPGVVLGILTADCAPVLLADTQAGVVGAAHAGWRGAMAGILEVTVGLMVELGAKAGAITAAVGPCIRQASYEVDADFRAAFLRDDAAAADLFRPGDRPGEDPTRFHFDLAAYVVRRLQRSGVGATAVQPHDTFADPERFFSFRRVTHAGGGDYGRLLSVITLEP